MKTIRIYSDESRHKNERFLLLGGIWIEEQKLPIVENEINILRNKYGYTNSVGKHIDFLGEFKWTKVSDKYLFIYKKLADLFFGCIDKNIMRSCIMLVDTQDPIVVNQSNIKKEGYFKLLYQLYLHNSRIPAIYKIFPDRITNPTQHNVNFEILDKCLEIGFKKKFADKLNPTDFPGPRGFVNNITPSDSKKCQTIQLIDVVMGAIGYYQNRHFEKINAKKAKIKLMKYVFEKFIYSGTMKFDGKKYMVVRSTKFNIWLFRPNLNNKKSPQ